MTTTDQGEHMIDHPADSAFWGYTEEDWDDEAETGPTCPTCGDTAAWCKTFREQQEA